MRLRDLKTLKKADRTEGMRTLLRVIRGEEVEELFSEGDSSLAFETLKAAAKSADGQAAESLCDPFKRAKARWALALYRDALYCHAGRRQAMGLGLHNALRGLYEGGRVGADYGE